MSYTIPIGPYHPSLEEPYKIEAICEGEKVQDVRLQIGYNFRGIEWLAERRNYTQNIALVERVCGICSNVHTLTFCMALEQLAGIARLSGRNTSAWWSLNWSGCTLTCCGRVSPPR